MAMAVYAKGCGSRTRIDVIQTGLGGDDFVEQICIDTPLLDKLTSGLQDRYQ